MICPKIMFDHRQELVGHQQRLKLTIFMYLNSLNLVGLSKLVKLDLPSLHYANI